MKDFFSKCDQIFKFVVCLMETSFFRSGNYVLKDSFSENFWRMSGKF